MERMGLRAVSPTLIGRHAELARLHRAIDVVAGGSRAVVLLAGEAGVGKTRLLQELVEWARGTGLHVCVGRCVDLGAVAWPLAPLREILDDLAEDLDPEAFDAVIGSARGVLAGLLPDLDEPTPREQPLGQEQLCAAVFGVVGRLARRGPLLIAFEDLHWADPSTLALFATLAGAGHRRPVLLVASFRSDELHRRHPLLPVLGSIERADATDRIDVPPLDAGATRTLVEALLGDDVDAGLAADVYARTAGNAYYIEELIAARRSGSGDVSASLRDAILGRTTMLDDDVERGARRRCRRRTRRPGDHRRRRRACAAGPRSCARRALCTRLAGARR